MELIEAQKGLLPLRLPHLLLVKYLRVKENEECYVAVKKRDTYACSFS